VHQPQEAPQQGQAGVHGQADGEAIVLHHLQHRVADGLPVGLAEGHHLRHVEQLHLLQLPGQRHVGLDTLLQMVTTILYFTIKQLGNTPANGNNIHITNICKMYMVIVSMREINKNCLIDILYA
jgi:hypothetical protein